MGRALAAQVHSLRPGSPPFDFPSADLGRRPRRTSGTVPYILAPRGMLTTRTDPAKKPVGQDRVG